MKTKKLLATILMSTTALLACGNSVSAMWGYGYGWSPQPGSVPYEQIGQAATYCPGPNPVNPNMILQLTQEPTDKHGPNLYADDFLGNARGTQEASGNIGFKYNF
jgi:hypothetical protein